jgi:hypothetical protein
LPVTSGRSGEQKVTTERLSGSLDPGQASTHSAEIPSTAATAANSLAWSLSGSYRLPRTAFSVAAATPSANGPVQHSLEPIRTAPTAARADCWASARSGIWLIAAPAPNRIAMRPICRREKPRSLRSSSASRFIRRVVIVRSP